MKRPNIYNLTLKELISMRADIIREGWTMTFTVAEINAECDRRNKINSEWRQYILDTKKKGV